MASVPALLSRGANRVLAGYRRLLDVPPGPWALAAYRWAGARPTAAVAVGLGAAVAAALSALDELLAAFHAPGAPSYSMDTFQGVHFRTPEAAEAVTSWRQFDAGVEIARWYVGLDFAFIPLYGLVLAIALLSVHRRLWAEKQLQLEAVATARRERIVSQLEVYRRLVRVAMATLPLLLLADVFENVLIWRALRPSGDAADLEPRILAAADAKWVLAVLIVLPLAVAALQLVVRARERGSLSTWTGGLVALRGSILLVALYGAFVLGVEGTGQAPDVLRRWADDEWDAVAAILLTLWFSLLTLAASRRLLPAAPGDPVPTMRAIPWFVLALVAALLFAFAGWRDWAAGFLAPAIVVAVVLVLSVGVHDFKPEPARPRFGGAVLVPLLAAAPLVALGLALERAVIGEAVYADRAMSKRWLAVGLAVQAAGWLVALLAARRLGKLLPGAVARWWPIGVSAAVAAAIWLRMGIDPWRTADALGGVGIVAAFGGAMTLIAFWLVWLEERLRPPAAFAVVRLRRIPVFSLLVVWAVLAALLDPRSGHYDVRVVEGARPAGFRSANPNGPGVDGLSVRVAFKRWKKRQVADARASAAGTQTGRAAIPMLFVATAGGGIRAAYWAALVMDCVVDGGTAESCGDNRGSRAAPRGAVFAASGASGGSFGLATWATQQAARGRPANWIRDRLGHDGVAATIGWSLFFDIPNGLLHFNPEKDAAEVLERTWELAWKRRHGLRSIVAGRPPESTGRESGPLAGGFYALRHRAPRRVPLLFLSGTEVQEGCRFNVSVVDANVERPPEASARPGQRLIDDCLSVQPFEAGDVAHGHVAPTARADWALAATDDLDDFLCTDDDIRISTAALLSARFPFVLPSGRLPVCARADVQPEGAANREEVNIVDGGYFDNTGASAILELWTKLEPLVDDFNTTSKRHCVVPLLVQIDSHYLEPRRARPQREPWELNVPLRTVQRVRGAREANSRQAAAVLFSGPTTGVRTDDRYAHIHPHKHPGTEPPLGWTLSSIAMDDLDRQLEQQNEAEIRKVKRWFADGALSCTAAR